MSRDQKTKESPTCTTCSYCTYLGEGDHICDYCHPCEVIYDEWTPTEKFFWCGGEHYIEQ